MMIPYFSTSEKEPYPTSKSSLPIHKIKSDASWGGKTEANNIEFINYKQKKTFCGTR